MAFSLLVAVKRPMNIIAKISGYQVPINHTDAYFFFDAFIVFRIRQDFTGCFSKKRRLSLSGTSRLKSAVLRISRCLRAKPEFEKFSRRLQTAPKGSGREENATGEVSFKCISKNLHLGPMSRPAKI